MAEHSPNPVARLVSHLLWWTVRPLITFSQDLFITAGVAATFVLIAVLAYNSVPPLSAWPTLARETFMLTKAAPENIAVESIGTIEPTSDVTPPQSLASTPTGGPVRYVSVRTPLEPSVEVPVHVLQLLVERLSQPTTIEQELPPTKDKPMYVSYIHRSGRASRDRSLPVAGTCRPKEHQMSDAVRKVLRIPPGSLDDLSPATRELLEGIGYFPISEKGLSPATVELLRGLGITVRDGADKESDISFEATDVLKEAQARVRMVR